ncbi:hypothetical protein B0H15DRAFT_1022629 [Mycena belliarum]|uniref:Uncharacterized protein n=1 Tax=Mycena belliarum TaxID=1033014 RepID=A0AAD6U7S6_9AGAR|nr:hypothetical protein B0H15DRAFT_1022629 [Mycena belliae]
MHATSQTMPAVHQTMSAAPNHSANTEPKPVNQNGPQCCHCGWRGGEHASNCPFSTRAECTPSLPATDIPLRIASYEPQNINASYQISSNSSLRIPCAS